MEYKQRAKMSVSQRAKQFMPFAAVKGLEEAILEQDQLLKRTEKIELGEERTQKINRELNHMEKGKHVSLKVYRDGRYDAVQGVVEWIDTAKGTMRVSGVLVPFESVSEFTYGDVKQLCEQMY